MTIKGIAVISGSAENVKHEMTTTGNAQLGTKGSISTLSGTIEVLGIDQDLVSKLETVSGSIVQQISDSISLMNETSASVEAVRQNIAASAYVDGNDNGHDYVRPEGTNYLGGEDVTSLKAADEKLDIALKGASDDLNITVKGAADVVGSLAHSIDTYLKGTTTTDAWTTLNGLAGALDNDASLHTTITGKINQMKTDLRDGYNEGSLITLSGALIAHRDAATTGAKAREAALTGKANEATSSMGLETDFSLDFADDEPNYISDNPASLAAVDNELGTALKGRDDRLRATTGSADVGGFTAGTTTNTLTVAAGEIAVFSGSVTTTEFTVPVFANPPAAFTQGDQTDNTGEVFYLQNAGAAPFNVAEKFYFCEDGQWFMSPFISEEGQQNQQGGDGTTYQTASDLLAAAGNPTGDYLVAVQTGPTTLEVIYSVRADIDGFQGIFSSLITSDTATITAAFSQSMIGASGQFMAFDFGGGTLPSGTGMFFEIEMNEAADLSGVSIGSLIATFNGGQPIPAFPTTIQVNSVEVFDSFPLSGTPIIISDTQLPNEGSVLSVTGLAGTTGAETYQWLASIPSLGLGMQPDPETGAPIPIPVQGPALWAALVPGAPVPPGSPWEQDGTAPTFTIPADFPSLFHDAEFQVEISRADITLGTTPVVVVAADIPTTGMPRIFSESDTSGQNLNFNVGELLTADMGDIADDDGNPQPVAYAWVNTIDDSTLGTEATLDTTGYAGNEVIRLYVSIQDSVGYVTQNISSFNVATAILNVAATGQPAITCIGHAAPGKTLTADVSGIADAQGLTGVDWASVAYSWESTPSMHPSLRNWTPVAGGDEQTYTVPLGTEGLFYRVNITGIVDDAGNQEGPFRSPPIGPVLSAAEAASPASPLSFFVNPGVASSNIPDIGFKITTDNWAYESDVILDGSAQAIPANNSTGPAIQITPGAHELIMMDAYGDGGVEIVFHNITTDTEIGTIDLFSSGLNSNDSTDDYDKYSVEYIDGVLTVTSIEGGDGNQGTNNGTAGVVLTAVLGGVTYDDTLSVTMINSDGTEDVLVEAEENGGNYSTPFALGSADDVFSLKFTSDLPGSGEFSYTDPETGEQVVIMAQAVGATGETTIPAYYNGALYFNNDFSTPLVPSSFNLEALQDFEFTAAILPSPGATSYASVTMEVAVDEYGESSVTYDGADLPIPAPGSPGTGAPTALTEGIHTLDLIDTWGDTGANSPTVIFKDENGNVITTIGNTEVDSNASPIGGDWDRYQVDFSNGILTITHVEGGGYVKEAFSNDFWYSANEGTGIGSLGEQFNSGGTPIPSLNVNGVVYSSTAQLQQIDLSVEAGTPMTIQALAPDMAALQFSEPGEGSALMPIAGNDILASACTLNYDSTLTKTIDGTRTTIWPVLALDTDTDGEPDETDLWPTDPLRTLDDDMDGIAVQFDVDDADPTVQLDLTGISGFPPTIYASFIEEQLIDISPTIEEMSLEWEAHQDFNGESLNVTSIVWKNNGVAITGQTTSTLPASEVASLNDGEVLSYEISYEVPNSANLRAAHATTTGNLTGKFVDSVTVNKQDTLLTTAYVTAHWRIPYHTADLRFSTTLRDEQNNELTSSSEAINIGDSTWYKRLLPASLEKGQSITYEFENTASAPQQLRTGMPLLAMMRPTSIDWSGENEPDYMIEQSMSYPRSDSSRFPPRHGSVPSSNSAIYTSVAVRYTAEEDTESGMVYLKVERKLSGHTGAPARMRWKTNYRPNYASSTEGAIVLHGALIDPADDPITGARHEHTITAGSENTANTYVIAGTYDNDVTARNLLTAINLGSATHGFVAYEDWDPDSIYTADGNGGFWITTTPEHLEDSENFRVDISDQSYTYCVAWLDGQLAWWTGMGGTQTQYGPGIFALGGDAAAYDNSDYDYDTDGEWLHWATGIVTPNTTLFDAMDDSTYPRKFRVPHLTTPDNTTQVGARIAFPADIRYLDEEGQLAYAVQTINDEDGLASVTGRWIDTATTGSDGSYVTLPGTDTFSSAFMAFQAFNDGTDWPVTADEPHFIWDVVDELTLTSEMVGKAVGVEYTVVDKNGIIKRFIADKDINGNPIVVTQTVNQAPTMIIVPSTTEELQSAAYAGTHVGTVVISDFEGITGDADDTTYFTATANKGTVTLSANAGDVQNPGTTRTLDISYQFTDPDGNMNSGVDITDTITITAHDNNEGGASNGPLSVQDTFDLTLLSDTDSDTVADIYDAFPNNQFEIQAYVSGITPVTYGMIGSGVENQLTLVYNYPTSWASEDRVFMNGVEVAGVTENASNGGTYSFTISPSVVNLAIASETISLQDDYGDGGGNLQIQGPNGEVLLQIDSTANMPNGSGGNSSPRYTISWDGQTLTILGYEDYVVGDTSSYDDFAYDGTTHELYDISELEAVVTTAGSATGVGINMHNMHTYVSAGKAAMQAIAEEVTAQTKTAPVAYAEMLAIYETQDPATGDSIEELAAQAAFEVDVVLHNDPQLVLTQEQSDKQAEIEQLRSDAEGILDAMRLLTLPSITLTGGATQSIVQGSEATYTDPGYSASDAIGNDITGDVVVTYTDAAIPPNPITAQDIDISVAATYHIYYNVTDSQGLAAPEQTRAVVVAADTDGDGVVDTVDDFDNYAGEDTIATDVLGFFGAIDAPIPGVGQNMYDKWQLFHEEYTNTAQGKWQSIEGMYNNPDAIAGALGLDPFDQPATNNTIIAAFDTLKGELTASIGVMQTHSSSARLLLDDDNVPAEQQDFFKYFQDVMTYAHTGSEGGSLFAGVALSALPSHLDTMVLADADGDGVLAPLDAFDSDPQEWERASSDINSPNYNVGANMMGYYIAMQGYNTDMVNASNTAHKAWNAGDSGFFEDGLPSGWADIYENALADKDKANDLVVDAENAGGTVHPDQKAKRDEILNIFTTLSSSWSAIQALTLTDADNDNIFAEAISGDGLDDDGFQIGSDIDDSYPAPSILSTLYGQPIHHVYIRGPHGSAPNTSEEILKRGISAQQYVWTTYGDGSPSAYELFDFPEGSEITVSNVTDPGNFDLKNDGSNGTDQSMYFDLRYTSPQDPIGQTSWMQRTYEALPEIEDASRNLIHPTTQQAFTIWDDTQNDVLTGVEDSSTWTDLAAATDVNYDISALRLPFDLNKYSDYQGAAQSALDTGRYFLNFCQGIRKADGTVVRAGSTSMHQFQWEVVDPAAPALQWRLSSPYNFQSSVHAEHICNSVYEIQNKTFTPGDAIIVWFELGHTFDNATSYTLWTNKDDVNSIEIPYDDLGNPLYTDTDEDTIVDTLEEPTFSWTFGPTSTTGDGSTNYATIEIWNDTDNRVWKSGVFNGNWAFLPLQYRETFTIPGEAVVLDDEAYFGKEGTKVIYTLEQGGVERISKTANWNVSNGKFDDVSFGPVGDLGLSFPDPLTNPNPWPQYQFSQHNSTALVLKARVESQYGVSTQAVLPNVTRIHAPGESWASLQTLSNPAMQLYNDATSYRLAHDLNAGIMSEVKIIPLNSVKVDKILYTRVESPSGAVLKQTFTKSQDNGGATFEYPSTGDPLALLSNRVAIEGDTLRFDFSNAVQSLKDSGGTDHISYYDWEVIFEIHDDIANTWQYPQNIDGIEPGYNFGNTPVYVPLETDSEVQLPTDVLTTVLGRGLGQLNGKIRCVSNATHPQGAGLELFSDREHFFWQGWWALGNTPGAEEANYAGTNPALRQLIVTTNEADYGRFHMQITNFSFEGLTNKGSTYKPKDDAAKWYGDANTSTYYNQRFNSAGGPLEGFAGPLVTDVNPPFTPTKEMLDLPAEAAHLNRANESLLVEGGDKIEFDPSNGALVFESVFPKDEVKATYKLYKQFKTSESDYSDWNWPLSVADTVWVDNNDPSEDIETTKVELELPVNNLGDYHSSKGATRYYVGVSLYDHNLDHFLYGFPSAGVNGNSIDDNDALVQSYARTDLYPVESYNMLTKWANYETTINKNANGHSNSGYDARGNGFPREAFVVRKPDGTVRDFLSDFPDGVLIYDVELNSNNVQYWADQHIVMAVGDTIELVSPASGNYEDPNVFYDLNSENVVEQYFRRLVSMYAPPSSGELEPFGANPQHKWRNDETPRITGSFTSYQDAPVMKLNAMFTGGYPQANVTRFTDNGFAVVDTAPTVDELPNPNLGKVTTVLRSPTGYAGNMSQCKIISVADDAAYYALSSSVNGD